MLRAGSSPSPNGPSPINFGRSPIHFLKQTRTRHGRVQQFSTRKPGYPPAKPRSTLELPPQTFNHTDLATLREELRQSGLDSWQAGELISAFLSGRGYGVSNVEARTAASVLESGNCNMELLQQELSRLALSM